MKSDASSNLRVVPAVIPGISPSGSPRSTV